jgi:GWxTD domain-containing protein
MIFLLFMQIEWQTINRPYSNTETELVVNFTVPRRQLRAVELDSLQYVEYETQLIIYDDNGNQITGDYWETQRLADTNDIRDSVKIITPTAGRYFNFKILDRNAGTVFNLTENILLVNHLGDIQWTITDDTLFVTYLVLNSEGLVDNMTAKLKGFKKTEVMNKGVYRDTLQFNVYGLPNGDYDVNIEVYRATKKIETLSIPIKIARPFYLDDVSWDEHVTMLEYIATPSELKELEGAKLDDRDSLWHAFWAQYDPTPNTDYNEKEYEYFERIEYSEKNFSHGDKGWRSDRGRIYVQYGQPDEIQRRPYELYAPAVDPMESIVVFYDSYEIWMYYKMNRRYIFGDRTGLGEYVLLNPGGSSL